MLPETLRRVLWQLISLSCYILAMIIFVYVAFDLFFAAGEEPQAAFSMVHLGLLLISMMLFLISGWLFRRFRLTDTPIMGPLGTGGVAQSSRQDPDRALQSLGYGPGKQEEASTGANEVRCGACGAINEADYRYCGSCSARL